MIKVRIKKVPGLKQARTGYQVQGSLVNDVSSYGKGDYSGEAETQVTRVLQPVPRQKANLEAEKNETVVQNDGSGMPAFYRVGGKRHYEGGTPLNLPDDSFIFSDTQAMKIKDPAIIKKFGFPPKKGDYTPATISKKYDLNPYRKILQDPNSDKLERKTAEMMLKNYTMKLGELALIQESMKGFPQGIPLISKPYMEANKISEEDILPQKAQEKQSNNQAQNYEQKGNMPQEMPSGEPIAQSVPQDQMMQMGQPPMAMYGMEMYNPIMMNGGYPHRRLRRAQDGMQQPSEEEMMMMQQQQAQQQGGQEMMQQISQALEQGAQPEQIIGQLIQQQVPPQEIMQIFAQLGMPQEEIGGIIQSVMQEMQGGQQQMDPRQMQQGISEEEMMMMQQQDPRQMQEAPMAMYGMNMGGYDMPFYNDPNKMQYGGYLPTAKTGAITPYEKAKTKQGNVTPTGKQNKFSDRGQKLNEYLGQWESRIPGIKEMSEGQAQKAIYDWSLENNPDAIRSMWKEFGLTNKGLKNSKTKALSEKGTGQFTDEMLKDPELLKQLEDAYVDNYFGVRQLDPTEKKKEEEKEKEKEDGSSNNVQKCMCPDENGVDVETPMTDGKCLCDDYEEVEGDAGAFAGPRKRSGVYLQDTINTVGAYRNLMNLNKYLPTTQRMQPEEFGVGYVDPTRNIAAQSEQTGQLARGITSTAGGPGSRANLVALQGQLAAGAANTASQYDNQNVGIGNQYKQGLGALRNQYNMFNNQRMKLLGDENTIANQAYDNSETALRGDLGQATNTTITNAAAADAVNQMTPNYQIDPESGGYVDYTPTEQTLDPGTKQKDALEFAYELQGLSPKMQELLFKQAYGRYGGQFANGGMYVMGDSVFPFMFY